ncbi:MAG: DUF5668 domain-containing protein [Ignavibacteriales bacterium]|nr:DUF5668 domain-containing protein [Ignavibacteriales bacterium]
MQTSNRRIWLGIILIALGSLFFLDNLNFFWFDMRHAIFSWHTIFLILGIVILINHKNSLAGYIFLIIGLFGTARHYIPFFFDFDFGDLWPLILLVIGLWLILKRRGPLHVHSTQFNVGSTQTQGTEYSQDIIDETCVFTSCNKIIHSENFKGGKISIVFGTLKLDLNDSKLATGNNILEVDIIFGEAKIRVPQNWKVLINESSIFGGFNDKRFINLEEMGKSEGVLVIRGSNIFGSGQITN